MNAREHTDLVAELQRANRHLTESQTFLRKLVAMVVMQEGGTLTIGAQAQEDAALNADPTILTHINQEDLSIRVTVLKPGKPT